MTKIHQYASVKIDRGLPVPSKKGSGRHRLYPWLEMKVGDSFLFPDILGKTSGYRACYNASKSYSPRKFTCRKTQEGLRCWRIA